MLLVACESAPFASETATDGPRVVVDFIDAHFVRVGGERMPWEELILRMRLRIRELRTAGVDPSDWPLVELRSDPDVEVPTQSFEEIQAGLRRAGVRRISLGGA